MNPLHQLDQCQNPNGCSAIFFTYCPHCQLNLCIEHLNEHHQLIRNGFSIKLDEIEQEKSRLGQLMNKLNAQKLFIDQFYEQQSQNLTDFYAFTNDLIEKKWRCSDIKLDFQRLNELKNSKIPSIETWMRDVDRIFAENSNPNKMNVDDHSVSDEEISINVRSDGESDFSIDEVDSKLQNSNKDESLTTVLFKSDEFYSHECPLSSTDAFGLPDDCKIPAVPCDFVFEEKSINPDVCYHHLITRHNLKNKIARMITDEYLKAKRDGKDLTKIDILSDLNLPKILSESTAQFVTFCPLTKSNVFGLQADKHYRSCFSKTTIYLQQHLRHAHRFKTSCARRLVKALIDCQSTDEILFSENESVTENSRSRLV